MKLITKYFRISNITLFFGIISMMTEYFILLNYLFEKSKNPISFDII